MQVVATCQRKREVTFFSLLWNSHLTKGTQCITSNDAGGPGIPLGHKECTKLNTKNFQRTSSWARSNALVFQSLYPDAKLFPSKKWILQVQSLILYMTGLWGPMSAYIMLRVGFNLHGLECVCHNWGKVRVLINGFMCTYVIWVCSKVTGCAYLVGGELRVHLS